MTIWICWFALIWSFVFFFSKKGCLNDLGTLRTLLGFHHRVHRSHSIGRSFRVWVTIFIFLRRKHLIVRLKKETSFYRWLMIWLEKVINHSLFKIPHHDEELKTSLSFSEPCFSNPGTSIYNNNNYNLFLIVNFILRREKPKFQHFIPIRKFSVSTILCTWLLYNRFWNFVLLCYSIRLEGSSISIN